jgi:glucuronate isomerase
MNVEVVCTTDDPVDMLEFHRRIRKDPSCTVKVRPAFRADMTLNIERGPAFVEYVKKLGTAADVHITTYRRFLDAIRKRHAYFHKEGCRLSDHGLETAYAEKFTEREVASAFARAMTGKKVEPTAVLKFKSAVLFELCLLDHAAGWVQQFHLGAMRNINPRMYRLLGPDTGYDSIGGFALGQPLARLFSALEDRDALAKTIVYNINPADNEVVATLVGSFQDGRTPGKMQYGSAWWFLDQKEGMERQLGALSNMGLLSRFVGMLTDSRSFLSYPRHDYFRRLLCNILGTEIEQGLIPRDLALVGSMVADICYGNARRYFDFWGK